MNSKEKALKIVENFIKAKELIEEANKIISNCNHCSFCANIKRIEDFEVICKELNLKYSVDVDSNVKKGYVIHFYKTRYNGLEIVCLKEMLL